MPCIWTVTLHRLVCPQNPHDNIISFKNRPLYPERCLQLCLAHCRLAQRGQLARIMAEYDSEITIVLAGKSGVGKSTLMNNLLRKDTVIRMSPVSTTERFIVEEGTHDRIKIRVIDTRGLAELKSDKKKELKRLSSFTNGKADILLYCVPVGPGSKFDDANPVTMRCLTEAYGKQIWDHCVLVFTMSDMALKQSKRQNQDTATADYKTYLNRYTENFKEQLHRLGVKDKEVKTVFNLQDASETNTIIAVPVGWSLEDEVLPGIDQLISELYPELSGNANPSWRDVLFAIITFKCPDKSKESILKYRYGEELAHKIMVKVGAGFGGASGAAAGALAGGMLGGVTGTLGGPPGTIAGAIFGIVVGASLFGTAGGTALGFTATKFSEKLEKRMIDKEVDKIQKVRNE